MPMCIFMMGAKTEFRLCIGLIGRFLDWAGFMRATIPAHPSAPIEAITDADADIVLNAVQPDLFTANPRWPRRVQIGRGFRILVCGIQCRLFGINSKELPAYKAPANSGEQACNGRANA